jgi:hypothetical protein
MIDFNSEFYIVYNIIKYKTTPKKLQAYDFLFRLYSILLDSDNVVTIQQFQSTDNLTHELRVIFWNHESYLAWADVNREEYQQLIYQFETTHEDIGSTFTRTTSHDGYISEFPHTYFPKNNELSNWILIPLLKDYFAKNLIPIGTMVKYLGDGVLQKNKNLQGSRFLKERTGSIVRLGEPNKMSTSFKNYPTDLLAYSFDHAIQVCMYDYGWLYRKLRELNRDVEAYAERFIADCEHSAVLVGHNSLGDNLTLHTHRLTETNKFTFTITVRLSFDDNDIELSYYDPIPNEDKNLPFYYTHPVLVERYIKTKQEHKFKMGARSSVLLFSASYIPHTVNFTNDIYLFFVYDNVTFKPGMFEEMTKDCQVNSFPDNPSGRNLFYKELPNSSL